MDELWADTIEGQIVKNTNGKRWCMSCMAQYGQYKDKITGEKIWHLKAQKMAYWIITSKRFSPGAERAYCLSCINELENIDGKPYPIQDQLRDAQKLDKFWKLSSAVGKAVDTNV